MPNIRNVLKDPTNNVTYEVMAYRALTQEELLQSVGVYLGQLKRKRKKAPRNTTVRILTVHGGTPNL